MARAQDGSPGAASASRGRHTADEARIIDRFKRLGPQKQALGVTLRPFSDDEGRFDLAGWERAFSSDDPETIAKVVAVTGAYQLLVNHLVEMLQAAGRIAGLSVCQTETKPSARALLNAVKADGGLTANQVNNLMRLYRTRNELQHSSLDVQADQVHADIELISKTVGDFVKSYLSWLERYDVQILPTR